MYDLQNSSRHTVYAEEFGITTGIFKLLIFVPTIKSDVNYLVSKYELITKKSWRERRDNAE